MNSPFLALSLSVLRREIINQSAHLLASPHAFSGLVHEPPKIRHLTLFLSLWSLKQNNTKLYIHSYFPSLLYFVAASRSLRAVVWLLYKQVNYTMAQKTGIRAARARIRLLIIQILRLRWRSSKRKAFRECQRELGGISDRS